MATRQISRRWQLTWC